MDPQLPITRRDAVALFVYVFIGTDVLVNLLQLLNFQFLRYFSLFSSRFLFGALAGPLVHLIQLLLLPLVPLIASGVTGRYSETTVTKRAVRALIFPCIGIAMCGLSIPSLLSMTYYYFLYKSTSSVISYPMTYLVSGFINFSLGFALAFFPAIFDSLRARVRDEEGA